VLNYLLRFVGDDVELILVEQDGESRLEWMKEIDGIQLIKHVLLYNGNVFNKGWGYNLGAKLSQGDYLLFSDADLYIRPESYMGLLSYFPQYDVTNPYNEIFYIDRVNSDRFVAEGYNMNLIWRPGAAMCRVKARVVSGGIFTIKRDVFLRLKGFDETCVGFGYEDDIFDAKMRKSGVKIKDINDYCVHVFHKSVREGMDKRDKYFASFQHNKELFEQYEKMTSADIAKKIENIQVWGEGKYDYLTH
jgi:glycosyltransferase involved in cell wall biosynthesis